ncbi:ribonuclease HI [Rhizobium grahamii]|uniref:ribonuclease H n=1 Tax=Rhizobium grahamii TaxID=1120045 RepID=A0A5Q0C9D2_9HYPH|nr:MULTISPECIES: ribonuclease H [Rhizobium]QFY62053.1 ribonuclease HI [Rhizobium grahamii]QRM48768.1 ribonuclease HI [Rhizobium sp. BG6]
MTDNIDTILFPESIAASHSLHVFADGCYEPVSGEGGWAFAVYRDDAEIASGFGGVKDTANNTTELIALLEAVKWINANATEETAVVWSDSAYAVRGCNQWRHIWKNNGWKKISANTKLRGRTIANAQLWKAIDGQLSLNRLMTIAWCKGHAGLAGNERADELAERGRLSLRGKGDR